jgi:uncharacterized ParB-like nuclease family protein
LEKTMEADISTLRKTGHFYFALTGWSRYRVCVSRQANSHVRTSVRIEGSATNECGRP